jgi:hypothetical protein
MQRRPELDAARGFMLVWMTLTHLPTQASVYANQTFGFVSSAEGFIFLSALFTGLIYQRMALRVGVRSMWQKIWSRTFRLYVYHIFLLAFAFLVAVPIAASGKRQGLHYLLDYYFLAGAKRAILESAILIYRPPLLDILPMYIFFLLFTPIALLAGMRRKWNFVLGISFTLWLLAQFGFRQTSYDFLMHHFGLQIPLNEMGAFDLWAWQFLWVLGLWFGTRWAQDNMPVRKWAAKLLVPAAIIAPMLLALRYAVGNRIELGSLEVCFDKWHLGVVRLINFAAISVLLACFPAVLQKLSIRPLVLMGQASLQVFCVHLLFCFGGLTLLGNASMLDAWQQIVLLVITFAGLLLTATAFPKERIARDQGTTGLVGFYRNWQKTLLGSE